MVREKSRKIVSNVFWLLLIVVLIIPQSRQALQVSFHELLSKVNSIETLESDQRPKLSTFNWDLLNENGERYNFSQATNKVILINFWATWCPPCIAEMDSLEKLYKAYDNEVIFLFVTNDKMEVVKAFKDKRSYSFPVYYPISQIPSEFETKSIPRTFILNRKGEIVIDEKGALDWNSETVHNALDELLAH